MVLDAAWSAVWDTKNAVKQTKTQRVRDPVLPMRKAMISRNAELEGPGRFSNGPEHKTSTMFKIQPISPVPITAINIAEGAA